jgi:hypothetical protein
MADAKLLAAMIVSAMGRNANIRNASGLIHPRGTCNPKNNALCSDFKSTALYPFYSRTSDKDGDGFAFGKEN